MSNLLLYLGIYIGALLLIAYHISRKETSEDFLIGGRNRKGWQILLSKFAGSIGVTWFVTYTGYAYEYGLGLYLAIAGFIVSYVIFAYWAAPRIHRHSKTEKFYTQGDFVFYSTKNRFTKLLTNTITSLTQALFLLVGIVGGAKIMSHFGTLSYEAAVVLTSSVVLGYILLAGFKAVIATDILQSGIILILLGFLTFVMIRHVDFGTIVSVQTDTMSAGIAFGFLLYGLGSVFCGADRYQLCYAAKDAKRLRRGMAYAVVPIVITASLLLLIGMFMKLQSGSLDSGLIFLEAMRQFLPASLIPIGIVLFFAGLMSSTDTSIYAIASHYVFSKRGSQSIRHIRIATIVLVIIISLAALLFRDIIDITVVAAALMLTLTFPMIYIIAGKKSSQRFIGSVCGGIIGLLVGVTLLGTEPSIMLPVLLGGALGLLYKKRNRVLPEITLTSKTGVEYMMK